MAAEGLSRFKMITLADIRYNIPSNQFQSSIEEETFPISVAENVIRCEDSQMLALNHVIKSYIPDESKQESHSI